MPLLIRVFPMTYTLRIVGFPWPNAPDTPSPVTPDTSAPETPGTFQYTECFPHFLTNPTIA